MYKLIIFKAEIYENKTFFRFMSLVYVAFSPKFEPASVFSSHCFIRYFFCILPFPISPFVRAWTETKQHEKKNKAKSVLGKQLLGGTTLFGVGTPQEQCCLAGLTAAGNNLQEPATQPPLPRKTTWLKPGLIFPNGNNTPAAPTRGAGLRWREANLRSKR